MARIGAALGVSQKQISRDMENLDITSKLPRAEKRGRKKQKKRREGVEERYEKIVALHDAGMTAALFANDICADGLHKWASAHCICVHELGRRAFVGPRQTTPMAQFERDERKD